MNEICQLVAILSPTILTACGLVIHEQHKTIKKLAQDSKLSQSKLQLLQAHQLEFDYE